MGSDVKSQGGSEDSGCPELMNNIDNNSDDLPRVTSAAIDDKSEESNLEKVTQSQNETCPKMILKNNIDSTVGKSNGFIQKQTHKLNPKRKAKVFGRGPGRPPGSLNRSTIARLKAEAEALEEFEKSSNSVLPSYTGKQLTSTDQSSVNQSFLNGIAQSPQYYSTQYLPSHNPDHNFTNGYMVNPICNGNFIAYQAHTTPITTQPYTYQLPPPSRTSYGNQEMISNNINSVAMQNSIHTSSSDWSQGSSNPNNGSNYLNLHNKEYERRFLELQKLERVHSQQSYNSSISQPGMINYNAYQPLIPNGYYHSNSLDFGKTFQPDSVFVPPLQTEQTFAMHNLSQPYSLNSTHLLPSNVQQITPFPMSIPASVPQQLPYTNSQYPAYLQQGNQPYERFPGPIQPSLPHHRNIYNHSIQRQNEQSALNNQPLEKN